MIPKLPASQPLSAWPDVYVEYLVNCLDHYKAIAEAQAELLIKYSHINSMDIDEYGQELINLLAEYNKLQREIEAARKPLANESNAAS